MLGRINIEGSVMKAMLLSLPALLFAATVQAEVVLSEVSGNWAAPQNDGFYYRAVLTQEGEHLRLRIYQGGGADSIESEPQFDNARIGYFDAAPSNDNRDWLEVGSKGELYLTSLTLREGYLYTERLTIQMMDNQFTAMGYLWSNDWSKRDPNWEAPASSDMTGCTSDTCYSCEADLWNGKAVAGGEAISVPKADFEALNASLWTPERVYELGYCPGPD